MPEGVPSPVPVEVVWEGGMRYRGGPAGGPSLVVDGDREIAPSPVDTLVVALASCSAIDVVEILQKRRTPASTLRVTVEFSRAPTPPRRLTDAHLRFTVSTASEQAHVERARSSSPWRSTAPSRTPSPPTPASPGRWSSRPRSADNCGSHTESTESTEATEGVLSSVDSVDSV